MITRGFGTGQTILTRGMGWRYRLRKVVTFICKFIQKVGYKCDLDV